MRCNIDCCVPVISTSAGDQELLQVEFRVNVVQGHAKIWICCSRGPVVSSETDSSTIRQVFGQDLVNLCFAIGVQERYLVPEQKEQKKGC